MQTGDNPYRPFAVVDIDPDEVAYAGLYDPMSLDPAAGMLAVGRLEDERYAIAFHDGETVDVDREVLLAFATGILDVIQER